MGTEKGMFKDKDKGSKLHLEVSNSFADKKFVYDFLWEIIRIAPKEIKIELEKPIYSKNGFLYGFVDCLINVEDIVGNRFILLCEFKTNLKDFTKTLRQINTYRTNLEKVDYVFLIVNKGDLFACDEDALPSRDFEELSKKLFDQGIILLDYFEIEHEFGKIDHLYSFEEENEVAIEDDSEIIELDMHLFLGEWKSKLIDYDPQFYVFKNKRISNVALTTSFRDPKYNKKTIIHEVCTMRVADIEEIFQINKLDDKENPKKSIDCSINVGLKPRDASCDQFIRSINIKGKDFYPID